MKQESKTPKKPLIFYYLIAMLVLLLLNALVFPSLLSPRVKEVSYDQFLSLVEQKEVKQVAIEDDVILFTIKDEASKDGYAYYQTGRIQQDSDLVNRLKESGAEFSAVIPTQDSPLLNFLMTWVFPILLFVALGQLMARMLTKHMGGNAMSFGKSNAKIYVESQTGKSFADVAGQDEAKDALREIVDFLHNPEKYTSIGATLPKGVLLVGPPGTGKTLLAQAVAGEAKVPFFSISGSEFVEMFVGMGAAKVRDLFKQAQEKAPCIVFIDEIDTIGKKRDSGAGIGGNDEREQTLNQLLAEMDGFDGAKGVVILAATNRPDSLDKALLRPGRFDRRVPVELPDLQGRIAILKVHTRNKNIGPDVDLKTIAATTAGFTGADLENLVNEAALLAARANRRAITKADIEEATIKVVAGPEKKSKVVTPEEKKLTAYHESGHAITTYFCKSQDKVHQVSIIPRGMAGGFTMHVPEKDRSFVSKTYMEEEIIVLLGGRVAEKLILDDISTGASNDIERATSVARNMVTRYGFSEKLGPILYGHENQEVFLGRDYSQGRNYSENVAAEIDGEIRELIETGYEKAKEILTEHGDLLERCAQYLMKHEKIDGPDFYKLMADEIDIDGNPKKKPEDIAETAPSEETKTETSPTEGIAPAENHEADSTAEPGEDKA